MICRSFQEYIKYNNYHFSDAGIILELGCGHQKEFDSSISIDKIPYNNVDICGDVIDILRELKDGSVSLIYSRHFLSHIDDLGAIFFEMDRVLKIGGVNIIIVPHFSNPYWYSDYTHKTFFGLYTFSYFFRSNKFRRKVPQYANNFQYTYKSIFLKFKSDKSFKIIYLLKYCVGLIFNLNTYLQELYEGSFTGLISCHEVEFVLLKDE